MTKRSRGASAKIVALERGGRRQHDVGMARGRRPPRLMHDDGFRPPKSGAQLVGVLMMVEWIAARPIDQLDVGIGALSAVEVVALARVQQAVGDARRRNGAAERIGQNLHCRGVEGERRLGNAGRGAITEAETAARKSDLAETRRQQNDTPKRLLAMIGALQRP